MSERFYLNSPLALGLVELTGPEAHHLATVSRLRPGDRLCLFNGDGHEYPARLVAAGKRAVTLDVVGKDSPDRELPFHLEVAAPIPKGDRAQFLVEKLTELGVRRYCPVMCARSVIHPGAGKLEKLQRHVIEASKQCGRNVLMDIAAPTTWADYCRAGNPSEFRLLAHPGAGADWPALDVGNDKVHARLAVGPEGGFTEEEIRAAMAEGWRTVSLGPRVLRLETAALVFATALITRLE